MGTDHFPCDLTANTKAAMRVLLHVAFVCLTFVLISSVKGEKRKAQLQSGRSLGNQGKQQFALGKSQRKSSNNKLGKTGARKQKESITKGSRKQGETKKDGARKGNQSKKGGTRKQIGGPVSEETQRSGSVPQARACDATCIDNAVKYMKMQRGKVATLNKQMSLITRHTSTADKKSSKNSVFETVVARLIDNSGGDIDNPECGSETTGSGVDQIKNLTNILMNCSVAVEAACADVPSVDVSTCNSSLVTFEALVTNCFGKDDGELCDCWTADDISSAYAELKDLNCDFKTEAALVKSHKDTCKGAFGQCRKYEDDVNKIIHSCRQDADALKQKLVNLNANSGALTDLQSKINGITGVTTTTTAPTTASNRRAIRQAPRSTSCSSFTTTTTSIVTLTISTPF